MQHEAIKANAKERVRWGVAAVLCFVCMLGSGWEMARRITAFHQNNKREVFAFRRISNREFSFKGRLVRLDDDRSDVRQPALVVHYGDATERIPMSVPPEPDSPRWKLPDLLPHEDWLRVLLMAPREGMSFEEWQRDIDSDKLETRLILATRTPRPGSDPATWGSVWKKDWVFDFYELMPDGSIFRHDRLKYPTTRGVQEPKPGELHENTWQFQAALQTMPQAGKIGPTHNFFGNAIAAAGWTLPASSFSGLAGTLATVFAFAPRRRARGSWRDPAPNNASGGND